MGSGRITAEHRTKRATATRLTARRFCMVARGCVVVGALAGSVLAVTAARAAEVEATGTLAPKAGEGGAWWRLRPAQGPVVEVPRTNGETLPEARRSVRTVYPAPYAGR